MMRGGSKHEEKISLYNHWIKFNDLKGNFSRIDEARSHWTPNRELAEYGIVEEKHPTKIIITGELGDNGEAYEDFRITVGGTSLYDALYEKYCGCNLKLTVEILP